MIELFDTPPTTERVSAPAPPKLIVSLAAEPSTTESLPVPPVNELLEKSDVNLRTLDPSPAEIVEASMAPPIRKVSFPSRAVTVVNDMAPPIVR